jgi:hypothetical protein
MRFFEMPFFVNYLLTTLGQNALFLAICHIWGYLPELGQKGQFSYSARAPPKWQFAPLTGPSVRQFLSVYTLK